MQNSSNRVMMIAASLCLLAVPGAKAQSVPSHSITEGAATLTGNAASDLSKFTPRERKIPALRPVQTPSLESSSPAPVSPPLIMEGSPGGPVSKQSLPAPQVSGGIGAQNYGAGQLGTLNQYSDSLIPTGDVTTYPYRTTGWFTFTTYDDKTYRCSAALISKSILLTAGHCVHEGGGGAPYWIKSGTFYPAYTNGTMPYGSATASRVYTTSGWFNTGDLDQGYDVALVVLNKRSGTAREMGSYTGSLGFCYGNCLQTYWQNTQLGYPGNYYSGNYMTMGQHLEYSDSKDYRSGSGMEGGSSGGPHVANIGSLSDTSTSAGSYPSRNIAFAATSWGFIDKTIKVQGYSSTSGPSNANNFKVMYNTACTYARSLHGAASCSRLP